MPLIALFTYHSAFGLLDLLLDVFENSLYFKAFLMHLQIECLGIRVCMSVLLQNSFLCIFGVHISCINIGQTLVDGFELNLGPLMGSCGWCITNTSCSLFFYSVDRIEVHVTPKKQEDGSA